MDMQVLDTRRDSNGGYKVDVSRGSRVGRVSSEWFSGHDDERLLSLGDLARSVRDRSDRSRTRVVESALIHVETNRNDPERLVLILPDADARVTPTHWSFGQLASQVGAPPPVLAQVVEPDLADADWTPTVENYLSRATKPRIVEASAKPRAMRPPC